MWILRHERDLRAKRERLGQKTAGEGKKTRAHAAPSFEKNTLPTPADGFEARDASGRAGGVRPARGSRAERRYEARARFRGRARRRATARRAAWRREEAHGTPRALAPGLESDARPRASSGRNAAGRRVDRRSPRGVGTVTSRGASALGARSTERPSRARATHGTPGPVAGRFVRVSAFRGGVVPWAVSCHRSAWRIVRCLFGGEARLVTIVASRGSLGSGVADERVVCADRRQLSVHGCATRGRECARASRDGAVRRLGQISTRRRRSREFAQFPEPSISASFCRFEAPSGSQTFGPGRTRF